MSFLSDLNHRYIELHTAKEDAFWAAKMNLKDARDGDLETNDIRLKQFITDASWLPKIRKELERDDLGRDDRISLEGWKRFFEANAIESDEAKELQKKIIEMEGRLARDRRDMKLGYTDPESGEFVPASSVQLRLIVLTNPDEAVRKAAWEGLRSIEQFVLEHGFLEIVAERNRLARLLGYKDYYDWQVKVNEGFSKERLFQLLDELEASTRDACKKSVDDVKEEFGEQAAEPWNFEYSTAGDLTAEKDPYMRFETAVAQWGRSFSALGIRYREATLTLDLVERKGKYENGFMHGPFPAYIDNGTFRPARINFTANAVPGQIGSGQRALETLFHEGGHAAHFSNIRMPAPCFSQEFAPTSIAYAETQSMFLDSIVSDPDWLARYASNAKGEPMPFELIKKVLHEQHIFRAHLLRKLMIVPYFEKALYEMSDEERTPEKVLETGRAVEARMVYQPSDARPILSVPHLLESDSSAYYHAYVLAMMAVYQTRAYFLKRDGHIMDNPKVGRDLAEIYWRPGNSKSFLDLVEELTGEPFSAKATVELVNKPIAKVYEEAQRAVEREGTMPRETGPIDLDATITMIHGDQVVSTTRDGAGFEEMAKTYGAWIAEQE